MFQSIPCGLLAVDFRAKVALITVFPHIKPMDIIILCSLQMQVLLENSIFLLHKVIRIAGIIRDAGNIRGRSYMRKYGMYHKWDLHKNPLFVMDFKSRNCLCSRAALILTEKIISEKLRYITGSLGGFGTLLHQAK